MSPKPVILLVCTRGMETRDAIAVNKVTIKSPAAKPPTLKQWHLSQKCVIGDAPVQSGRVVRHQREQVKLVWKRNVSSTSAVWKNWQCVCVCASSTVEKVTKHEWLYPKPAEGLWHVRCFQVILWNDRSGKQSFTSLPLRRRRHLQFADVWVDLSWCLQWHGGGAQVQRTGHNTT